MFAERRVLGCAVRHIYVGVGPCCCFSCSAAASAAAAAAAEPFSYRLLTVASLFFSFSLGEWGPVQMEWGPVLMGTGSRNFIGSTDFPSERSGTHLKKNPKCFFGD